MALTKNEKAALGVGAIVFGGALLYIVNAALDSNPRQAPIPRALGERLSTVVAMLNRKLGKRWGTMVLRDLRQVLVSTLPGWEVSLVDHIYAAEREGQQRGWSGHRKLQHAVALAGA